MREIHDAVIEPDITDIVLMCSAQVGKTEALLNLIAYFASIDPAPMMYVMPTSDNASDFSKDRLDGMIRNTPALHDVFPSLKSRARDSSVLSKAFFQGRLYLTGANSAANLASKPIRYLLCDEVDRFPILLNREGSPIDLAAKRTTAFFDAKRIWVSTPTTAEESVIYEMWKKGDQRFFQIACHECGLIQKLTWAQLKYDNNDPETARFECAAEGCSARWTDQERDALVTDGFWEKSNYEAEKGWASFHLWQGYSNFNTTSAIVRDWLNSKDDFLSLQTFVNTTLGEPWDSQTAEQTYGEIEGTVLDKNALPESVLMVGCTVDVQDGWLQYMIFGLGYDAERANPPETLPLKMWVLEFEKLQGSIEATHNEPESAWSKLVSIMHNWTCSTIDGRELKILATAVDSGYKPDAVHTFGKALKVYRSGDERQRRVFVIRGHPTERAAIRHSVTPEKVKRGIRQPEIYYIGTQKAKNWLAQTIARQPWKIVFDREACDDEFWRQMNSEVLKDTMRGGQRIRMWVHEKGRHPRNEALDLMVYATWMLHYNSLALQRAAAGVLASKKKAEESDDGGS